MKKNVRLLIQVVTCKDGASLCRPDNVIESATVLDLRLDSLAHWNSVVMLPHVHGSLTHIDRQKKK